MISNSDVLNYVNKDDIINVLRELVRRPSQNPPGNEKIVAEYIFNTMRDWEFDPNYVHVPEPERPSVAVVLKGTVRTPRLVLNGHIDVVPEGDIDSWSCPPFEGSIREGRLYGRGASDMKGGLTAAIIAAKAVKDSGIKLKGDLILHFAMGEETGEDGTKSLLAEGYDGEWGIVLEPTSLRVMTSEKGLVWYHFKIKGKPTHASEPEKGINAIEKATDLIIALRNYDRRISNRVHPLCGRAKCSVTMIKSGTKENVIPESCWLAVDRRILPSENIERVDGEFKSIIDELKKADPDFHCEWRQVMLYESAEIPHDHFLSDIVRKNTKKVTGIDEKPGGTLFSTDQRNFVNDANIPAISWGPGPNMAHKFDEYVDIDQVLNCTKILVLTIIDLLK